MKKADKHWAVAMLFFGVILGIFGNLFAGVMDRLVRPEIGPWYDVIVSAVFVFLLYYMTHRFDKLLGEKSDIFRK